MIYPALNREIVNFGLLITMVNWLMSTESRQQMFCGY